MQNYRISITSLPVTLLGLDCFLQRIVEILITKLRAIGEGIELSGADNQHRLLLLVLGLLLGAVVVQRQPVIYQPS